MLDLVVRNGRIVDGTGNPWVLGDIGIKDGKIVALRRGIETEALRTIDAKGKVVSPGFIDLHTHSDLTVLGNPRAESSIHQGVTTEGIGMCGSSPYPLSEQQREIAGGLRADFSGRPGEPPPEVNWTTLGGWRETVMARGGVAINLAPNVGHGAIRTTVMGAEGDGGEAVHPMG